MPACSTTSSRLTCSLNALPDISSANCLATSTLGPVHFGFFLKPGSLSTTGCKMPDRADSLSILTTALISSWSNPLRWTVEGKMMMTSKLKRSTWIPKIWIISSWIRPTTGVLWPTRRVAHRAIRVLSKRRMWIRRITSLEFSFAPLFGTEMKRRGRPSWIPSSIWIMINRLEELPRNTFWVKPQSFI